MHHQHCTVSRARVSILGLIMSWRRGAGLVGESMAGLHMTLTPNQHTSIRPWVIEDVEVQQQVDVAHGAERADVIVACPSTDSQAALYHTVTVARNVGTRTRTVHPLVEFVYMYLPADVAVPEQPQGQDGDEVLLVGDVVHLEA